MSSVTNLPGDRPDEIRIADLRDPQLTDLQRMALEYGDRHRVSLTEDAVLSAAVDRTGLDAFGPDDFRLRLRLWLGEIAADPNRTGLGRASIFSACVRHASNRLRIHHLLLQHPEIHDVEIVRPIVVAGLPRSGTTHLLNLVSADSRLRSLPLWESYEPVPSPDDQADGTGVDPRFVRCDREWQQMLATVPHVAAMHPMNPDHVHEEIELQLPDFSSYTLEWIARVPGWRDFYLAHDQTPHYEYMRTVLKILQWQHGPDRWVLKSPQHLEQLGPLLATFPDATVVLTHRDPVSIVQSAATMLTYAARLSYRSVGPDFYVSYWSDRIDQLLSASLRDAHLLDDGRRFDVFFDRFMADNLATVESIYDVAGLPLSADARRQIETHMVNHPRGKHGQVAYDLRADFGVEPAAVRERFQPYLEAFPVAIEVQ